MCNNIVYKPFDLWRLTWQQAWLPALSVGITYFAYGAQMREAGFSALQNLSANLFIYAIPGQLAMMEAAHQAATLLSIALAVLLVNARLMPMAMTITPLCRGRHHWHNRLNMHFVAMTTWINYLQVVKMVHPDQRAIFFSYFGITIWLISVLFGQIGYLAAAHLPIEYLLGLMMINPVYFALLLVQRLQRNKIEFVAIALAGVSFPIFRWLNTELAVLLTGFTAGNLVFVARYIWQRHGHE